MMHQGLHIGDRSLSYNILEVISYNRFSLSFDISLSVFEISEGIFSEKMSV